MSVKVNSAIGWGVTNVYLPLHFWLKHVCLAYYVPERTTNFWHFWHFKGLNENVTGDDIWFDFVWFKDFVFKYNNLYYLVEI